MTTVATDLLERGCHAALSQLPVPFELVVGDRLVCQYHGWQYNGCGELVYFYATRFIAGTTR